MSSKCFLCLRFISLVELKKHFCFEHNYKFSYGNCFNDFKCVNNTCDKIFLSFKSFRKHLTYFHYYGISLPNQVPTIEEPLEEALNNNDNNYAELNSLNNENLVEEPVSLNIHETIENIICDLRSSTHISETDFKTCLTSYMTMNKKILHNFDIPEYEIAKINKTIKQSQAFASQKKTISKKIDYVAPQRIVLDQRSEIRVRNGQNIIKTISDTFSYIPIIKTLMLIVSNKHLLNLINNEHKCNRVTNAYSSFINTHNFKNHELFSNFPNTIRLNLYYDDIEVANALGSKRGKHKLGIFYFTVQNFPIRFNTDLKNIFILQICYSWDIKKFGFNRILQPFVNDMKRLERGIEISLPNGDPFVLRAVLISLSGDTLAIHDISGFLSPSCKCFCRLCMITRDEFKRFWGSLNENNAVQRNEITHNVQLIEISNDPSKTSLYGLKENSILNSLNYFHVTKEGLSFDPMHDLLEGVVGMEIKFVLNHFIKKKFISVEFLNNRINNFRYGSTESKNKPSANFEEAHLSSNKKSIPQNAIQCWLLLRALPFLIGHNIPPDGVLYLDIFVLLIKILEICFAPVVNQQMVCELNYYIIYHEHLFVQLFPDISLINKHHHLRHYPYIIHEKGPIVQFSCLSYESKHKELKRQALIGQNFINLPFSLTKRQAFLQSKNIHSQTYVNQKIEILSSKLSKRTDCVASEYLNNFYNNLDDCEVLKIKSLKINNVTYQINNFILFEIENTNFFPTFVKIIEVISKDSDFFMFGLFYNVIYFHDNLNAYEVEETDTHHFFDIRKVKFYKPLSIWHTFDTPEKKFISRKEFY